MLKRSPISMIQLLNSDVEFIKSIHLHLFLNQPYFYGYLSYSRPFVPIQFRLTLVEIEVLILSAQRNDLYIPARDYKYMINNIEGLMKLFTVGNQIYEVEFYESLCTFRDELLRVFSALIEQVSD